MTTPASHPVPPAASTTTTGASLRDIAVSEISGEFFVPAYQRGYRWGPTEVTHLLDDITRSTGERYYLQPIVVRGRPDGSWELIDGQQRLTTLYLVMLYIQRLGLPVEIRYRLDYETRTNSRSFLDDPVEETHTANIDFFHIFRAYEAIGAWLDSHGTRKLTVAIDLFRALDEKVRIIWFEADPREDPATLFTRLNVGRIPLTDAELVKALILTRTRAEAQQAGADLADRAQEIVAQWDSIERDLRTPEIWTFITATDHEQATHISLLLDALAETTPDDHAFHTFETLRARIEAPLDGSGHASWSSSADQVWADIVDLHSQVLGWYEDRDLYHRIGFLIATGTSFRTLVNLAAGRTKHQFADGLCDRIRQQLNLTKTQVEELTYEDKETAGALLLMNVETIRRTQGSSERYSFLDHAAGAWSLEHIHAQNAEALNRAEQWEEWLRLHGEALADLPHVEEATRVDMLQRIEAARTARVSITRDQFRSLEQELVEIFSEAASPEADTSADTSAVHSIANLALLDQSSNSALKNGLFEVKRREIISRDKAGSYIPVCTRNAFLKYYTDAAAQQLHFWGAQDREGYLRALVDTLQPYLKAPQETAK